jgi:hypothetical protein
LLARKNSAVDIVSHEPMRDTAFVRGCVPRAPECHGGR